MKELDFFDAMGYIADDLVIEAKEVPMKQSKQKTRPVKIALIAAAIVVLLTGTVLAVVHYTRSADALEQRWNETGSTEMTAEQKDFVDARSIDVEYTVSDQGITMTIDSITTTADTVYFTYHLDLDESIDTIGLQHFSCNFGMASVVTEDGTVFPFSTWSSEPVSTYEYTAAIHFDVPEDNALADASGTLQFTIPEFSPYYGEPGKTDSIQGAWCFEIPLLSSFSPQVAKDDTLYLTDMEIYDIRLEDSGLFFTVNTERTDVAFISGAAYPYELFRENHPEWFCCSVNAYTKGGTVLESSERSCDYAKDSNECYWSIHWAAPVDPSEITRLVFSDGTTEIEIPLE